MQNGHSEEWPFCVPLFRQEYPFDFRNVTEVVRPGRQTIKSQKCSVGLTVPV
jgi:hypothetical protein